jgi:hypothetical protein
MKLLTETSQARRLFRVTVRPVYVFLRDQATNLMEYRSRIRTSGEIELDELGVAGPERTRYQPAKWLILRRVLPSKSVGPEDVFIDFGSGKGRVVFQAARYPFKRVIGVELSRELHNIAVENITRNRDRLRCGDVQLVHSDVLDYGIPDDVTVAFFHNPFTGRIFATVIDRLLASVDRRPRQVRIIYDNPVEHDRLMATGRIRLVKQVRGLRPEAEWAKSNSVHLYAVLPKPTGQRSVPPPA